VPRTVAAVTAALVAKGMVPCEKHHHMYRKSIEGVTTLVTRISHSGNTIGDHLGKLMANQCCLQLKEFWRLVDCDLTAEGWDDLVRARCAGGRNPFLGQRG
jgi:hypothetical protein